MAVQGQTGVTNLDGLHVAYTFTSRAVACTGAAQTVAHGLTVTPDTIIITQSVGNDGMGGAGTLVTTITAVSADATNINFTSGVAGGSIDIVAW